MSVGLKKLCTAAAYPLATAALFTLTACDKQKPAVYEVPKQTSDAPAVAAAADPHAGHDHAANPHGTAANVPKIKYTAPQSWKEQPAGGMRVARFTAPGKPDVDTDISIIPLPGMQAGKADIVNLWREQIKLPGAKEEELAGLAEKVVIGKEQGELYDMASTEPLINEKFKVRILVAMLPQDNLTWFFKVTGEDEAVREQKPAFVNFLKSVQFEAAPAGAAPAPMASMGAGMQGAMGAGAPSESKPEWQVPAGWKELPPTQMVLAKFGVAGEGNTAAEVAVSVFPGDVGGVPANINRWRRQIGLQPAEGAELDKLATPLETPSGKAILVDMKGTDPKTSQPTRMVGVMVPQPSRTWFYKMVGDVAVVEREKPALVKFAQSAKYSNAQ